MAIVDTSVATLSPDEHGRALRRAILASTNGTPVAWYDLFLCSFVTGLMLARLGFPHSDPLIGAIAAFSNYAAGCVASPVGAAIEACWAPGRNVDMAIREGVVELQGEIYDERIRHAMRVIAEAVPGVKAMRDDLVLVDPNAVL